MKLEIKDFGAVNLHDAKLLNVEEDDGYIRMEVNFALICLPVKGTDGKTWLVRNCSIECFGVTVSEKKEWEAKQPKQWHDAHLAKPCSNPKLPIYQIGSNEAEDSFLIISGFTREKNFVAWRITASQLELHWQSQEEFK